MSAQASQAAAQTSYNQASANVANAQSAVSAAATAVAAAKSQSTVDGINKLTLPAGYFTALKAYKQNTDASQQAALSAKVKSFESSGYQLNTYQDNEAAQKVILGAYDAPIHLTDQQIQDLSVFVEGLINQVRAQTGTKPVVVTQGSLDYVKAMVAGYNATGKRYHGHDEDLLNQVSDKFGLFYNENLMTAGDYYPAPQYLTLNDLYSRAYEGLTLMLFSDIDTWPHATSITGFENVPAFDDQQRYLGVDVDQWGNVVYELPVRSNNSTEAQFNTTTTYAATSNPSEALNKAEAALASTKVDLTAQQAKAIGSRRCCRVTCR
ncbi:SEC10/PgrA surface exclusion domain-containing protein [Limosilactobacillus fermentum]|uniref:SEC10/PgrA surface exclusion domain-containing protein n=1 Tax=Limosilactobacillus fermentum TaxID=1613 RepID=UPI003BF5D5DD